MQQQHKGLHIKENKAFFQITHSIIITKSPFVYKNVKDFSSTNTPAHHKEQTYH